MFSLFSHDDSFHFASFRVSVICLCVSLVRPSRFLVDLLAGRVGFVLFTP